MFKHYRAGVTPRACFPRLYFGTTMHWDTTLSYHVRTLEVGAETLGGLRQHSVGGFFEARKNFSPFESWMTSDADARPWLN